MHTRPPHTAPRRAGRRLALLALAVGLQLPPGARADALAPGQPAPPLVLHALDGRHIASHALPGKIVIVTFWATWCGPCREELPLLSRYAAQHAADGVEVLGFSLDDADALPQVRALAGTLSFPVGLLGSAWAGGYGRIWRMPVSFVIGRDGRLVDNGWRDPAPAWTAARLERVIGPLLHTHR